MARGAIARPAPFYEGVLLTFNQKRGLQHEG